MAEKRDWERCERGWRACEGFRKDGVELFLKKAKDGFGHRSTLGGEAWCRPAYSTRGMVLCSLLKVKIVIEASPTSKPTQTS